MNYLLDTDHLSVLQRRSSREFANLAQRVAAHAWSDIGVSIVSFHEQVLGAHAYLSRAKTDAALTRGYLLLEQILERYSVVPIVPFDEAAADVLSDLKRQKIRLPSMDLRIAAIALSRGLALVTRNHQDFGQIPSLATED